MSGHIVLKSEKVCFPFFAHFFSQISCFKVKCVCFPVGLPNAKGLIPHLYVFWQKYFNRNFGKSQQEQQPKTCTREIGSFEIGALPAAH